MNIILYLTSIMLIILIGYSIVREPFYSNNSNYNDKSNFRFYNFDSMPIQEYDQNYEFVSKNEYDYDKDTKFIDQYDNIVTLSKLEYKNLRHKIEAKNKLEPDTKEDLIESKNYIKNLDKLTNYPLVNRELSIIEFDTILSTLKVNDTFKFKNKEKLNALSDIKFNQKLLYSFHLVKEWILEQISMIADEELYQMQYVNNERYKYIEDQLLTYKANYKDHLEQFMFKMRVYRPNKLTHYIVYFDLIFDNFNIKYYINDIIIVGSDIQENIEFSPFKRNHYDLADTFDSNITINKSELNKFIQKKQKKQIYDHDRHHCFYKNASSKNECISITKNNNTLGIYDSPCIVNEDCPFYKRNNNYPNKRGGCIKGYCELPINISLLGYKEYIDDNKPFCYNCNKKNCNGIECNTCCEDQKNKELYPNLNGPDYAFTNDFNERIKHSDHFTHNNVSPIKLQM